MSFLQTIPHGFFSANDTLNALPTSIVEQLLADVITVLHTRVGAVSSENYFKLAEGSVKRSALDSAVNAVLFIFRGVIAESVPADVLGDLLTKSTGLNESAITLFVQTWDRQSKGGKLVGTGGDELSAMQQCLRLGRLVGMEWKLGVGIASTHCKSLGAPFVSLLLKVASPTGEVTAHSLELNLEEFQDFAKTFRDISQSLDAI